MPETTRPLLILPHKEVANRDKRERKTSSLHYPTFERQRERLTPQFQRLQQAIEARRAELTRTLVSTVPEQVLVLEIAGSLNQFFEAVKKVPELEWLLEQQLDEIEADDDFYFVNKQGKREDRPIPRTVFLVMSSHTAVEQVISLWNTFNNPERPFPKGLAPWKYLFQQLRKIRFWDVEDRLAETGILDEWQERLAEGVETVRFEIELWFREDQALRAASEAEIKKLLIDCGGSSVSTAMIPEIRYHAILAQAPITEVSTIINNQRTRLVKCDRIMFFRPLAQTSVVPLVETPTEIVSAPKDTPPAGTLPTVALLDGYPMQNHDLLAGRLIVDDPDGWEHTYRAGERCHGTSMASLIIHGELGKGEKPLGRPIYVRPILRPDPEDFVSYPREECIPRDCLPVDLIHRAVKRILDGDGTAPASAPSVCFINLSVGDRNRPLHRSVSPWARLLDWLSEKYGVLFLVSAGNHPEPIALEVDCKDYNGLFPDDLETQVLRSIAGNIRSRRILSPGEAINPLTIGAFHSDTSDGTPSGNIVDPFVTTRPAQPC